MNRYQADVRPATWSDVICLVRLALAAERRACRAGGQGVLASPRLPGQAGLHALVVSLNVLAGIVWTTSDRVAAATLTPRTGGRPWAPRQLLLPAAGVGAALAAVLPATPRLAIVALAAAGGWLGLLMTGQVIDERRPPNIRRLAATISREVWELGGAVSRGERSGAPLFWALVATANAASATVVLRTTGPERAVYYATYGFEIAATDPASGRVAMVRRPRTDGRRNQPSAGHAGCTTGVRTGLVGGA